MTHDPAQFRDVGAIPVSARPAADAPLQRFSNLVDLTAGEAAILRDLCSPAAAFKAAERIKIEGDEPTGLFFLHQGWALSSINVLDGGRQVVKVHRPGDIMGASSLPYEVAVESLTALTPAQISPIPLSRLTSLFTRSPRLGAVLYLLAQEEHVTLMDRLAATGRLDAKRNLIAFLLLMFRERPSGSADDAVHLPLTQIQIGDVLGLSTVHVNRILREMDREGLIRRDGYTYVLLDVPRLEALVGLPRRKRHRNPSWLPTALP